MKIVVAVLGSPSLLVLMASVDVMQHLTMGSELWSKSLGGRPRLPVPNSPYGLCGCKAANLTFLYSELRSCVKVEVDVLGSLSLIVRTVSVNGKPH